MLHDIEADEASTKYRGVVLCATSTVQLYPLWNCRTWFREQSRTMAWTIQVHEHNIRAARCLADTLSDVCPHQNSTTHLLQ